MSANAGGKNVSTHVHLYVDMRGLCIPVFKAEQP